MYSRCHSDYTAHPPKVTYAQHLRDQFSEAFDVYLAIIRQVRARVDTALGRNSRDWRLKNACPPCGYKVKIFYCIVDPLKYICYSIARQ